MGGLISNLAFKSKSEGLSSSKQTSFFDFKVKDIHDKEFSFDSLRDKKLIMLVNVASSCGLTTENYTEMVKAHERWRDKGFEIIAFPCNQFYAQENKSPEEIYAFVKTNFNAQFPIMERVEVNGKNTHPVYAYLRNNSILCNPQKKKAKVIPWNFAKFFVNNKGQVIQYFNPDVKTSDVISFIQDYIEK